MIALVANFFVVNVTSANNDIDTSQWTLQVDEALALEQQGEVSKALTALRQHADNGNGLAQFSYAWRLKGSADADQRSLACTYFVKSAQLNVPVGAQESGHCVRDGILKESEEKRLEMANEFYTVAIDNGLVAAYCDKAILVQNKPSQTLNELTALCEQVAAQGAVYAQETLVDLYSNPDGLNNNDKAIYWLQMAAEKSAKSAYRYALTLHQSGQIKPELTRFYFEAAAAKGYIPAYLETSALYLNAFAAETEQKKAEDYLAKAYLWANAWKIRNPNTEAPDWVVQIEQQVPKTWKASLDAKVAEHTNQFSG